MKIWIPYLVLCALVGGCADPENVAEHPVAHAIPAIKPGVYRITAVDVRPVATREVQPDYPPELRALVGGSALVLFTVRADGKTTDASVVRADDVLFGEAAVSAILKWRYRPAQVKGAAVACRMTLPFYFSSPYGYGQEGWTSEPTPDTPPAPPPTTSIEAH